MNILFVCTGNTCRSPMAEAILKDKFPEVNVQSAGVFAGEGQRANRHTLATLQENKIMLDHQSQSVTQRLLNWADVVLTMTTQHKQSLILEHPSAQEKYFTLKEYVSYNDQLIWEELKKAYATYEDERSQFIKENERKLDSFRLDEAVTEHFAADISNIQKLESSLINYDISDPFGGSVEVYQKTYTELERYILLLIDKLKHQKETPDH
ncbi:MAG TPA: low molecular weight protein arginine phosphatase [Virgibacillus sp.]|nr:low molecular weight protein arginine phosphatase [Virgibacillus sp.]